MRDFDNLDSHSERLLVAQCSGSMIRRTRRRVFLSPCRCCRTETQEQRVSLLKSLRRRVGARGAGTHQQIIEKVMQPQLSTRGFFARPSRRTYTNAQFLVNENIHTARLAANWCAGFCPCSWYYIFWGVLGEHYRYKYRQDFLWRVAFRQVFFIIRLTK